MPVTVPFRRPAVIVDDATRRQFLTLLGAAGLLTACSTGAPPPPAGPTTRTVTDLSGRTVDIPADPRRIVALDPNRVIVDLVALGFVPVGATTNPTNPGGGLAPTLGAAAQRITVVGSTGQADLERVAALTPDLIFYATNYQDIPVERLTTIAPVIVYPAAPPGLLEPLRWLGDLLGRSDSATGLERDLRAEFDARRADVGLDGRAVAAVNLANYEEGPTVSVAGSGTNVGEFVTLLGGRLVPTEIEGRPLTGTFEEVSTELVAGVLAPADFVIGVRYGGSAENDRRFAARVTDPVWRTVPAVAAGEVAYLDVQEAGGNTGLDGVRAALNDLAAR